MHVHPRSGAVVPVLLAMVLAAACARPAAAADDASPPLPASRWRAFQTGAVRADRLEHASLAMTIGLGAGLATGRPAAAILSASALGFGKELMDAGSDRFDWGDLAADLVGAGLAGLGTHALFR